MFTKFGLPKLVVSDKGTCNGIKQLTSALYYPSSNRLAERAVQVVKRGIKKNVSGSLSSRLTKTLLSYHTTPHTTTGVTLMFGQRTRIPTETDGCN